MQEIASALEMLKGAWPMIQPAISTVFGAVVARLFLRGNTSKEELEKIKQAKFSEIADKLLEGGHITHLEYYKCRNFNRIAQKADEVYQQHSESTDGIIDKTDKENRFSIDWFVRFFEDSGNISDEEMQNLWAKVLAGEIKQPGSFSLRTLDTLKNMSKREAEILQVVASYAVQIGDSYYICIDESLKKKYNYQKNLLTMYDCGIIENNIASHYDLTVASGVFMQVGSLICLSHNESSEKYALDLQRFTTTGNEFIRFVTPSEQYLLDFFQSLNNNYPKLRLTVHRVIQVIGDTVHFDKNSLI